MKLKYFLRGLASGIVVTTVILSIANPGGKENLMTEEQIIQKAKELGMVEKDEVSVSPTKEPTKEIEITQEPGVTSVITEIVQEGDKEEQLPTKTPKPTQTPKPTKTPQPTKALTPTKTSETVTITISSGMWSDSVAAQLKTLGAVESAAEFDQFLVANGYAERIAVGTYQIPAGSSYEQIAKIITRR